MSTDPLERRLPDDEISLWEILAILLRRRWTIVLTTVLVASAAVAFALVRAPTFTTQASFRPQGSEASASQLMALATQFGVNIPGVATNEEASPAFYAELLGSRGAVGLVLGGMVGLVLAFVTEAVRRPAPGDPARADFRAAWAGFVRSLPIIGRRAA